MLETALGKQSFRPSHLRGSYFIEVPTTRPVSFTGASMLNSEIYVSILPIEAYSTSLLLLAWSGRWRSHHW